MASELDLMRIEAGGLQLTDKLSYNHAEWVALSLAFLAPTCCRAEAQTGGLANPLTRIGPVGRPVGDPGAGSSVIS